MKSWHRLLARGVVQGVGFRPTVWRAARSLGMAGAVSNHPDGVIIDLLTDDAGLRRFISSLREATPRLARLDSIAASTTPPPYPSDKEFIIAGSGSGTGSDVTDVSPDAAICPECLADVASGRRHRYWLTTCTHCGPRFSITTALPYDRQFTTMARFPMCDDCRREYTDPADRRFHAQPIACHRCGPAYTAEPEEVVRAIRGGKIVMVKGIGGYNLMADARSQQAVEALRQLKNRPRKPFAVMTDRPATIATVSRAEREALESWRAPIVLCRGIPGSLAPAVAPGLSTIGVMLPYTAYHHALKAAFPIVVTSANNPGEAMITDDGEARAYAARHNLLIAAHNRPIANRVDDSVVRLIDETPTLLRRGRGYAPERLATDATTDGILALGADITSAWAFGRDRDIILSPYLGSLENPGDEKLLQESIENLNRLYRLKPRIAIVDAHPGYLSAATGRALGLPTVSVWHHHAHALSVMAEHGLTDGRPVNALVLDGTGAGPDNTVWGSELLECDLHGFRRLSCGPALRMPGGDRAAREPWRMAVSLLCHLGIDPAAHPALAALDPEKIAITADMVRRGINAPLSTGAGRLFDAMAALAGLALVNAYESEAPVILEGAAADTRIDADLSCRDLESALRRLITDNPAPGELAARFHSLYAGWWLNTVAERSTCRRIVMAGGVMQNRLLAEMLYNGLRDQGFEVFSACRVPPGDGGIAVGQLLYGAFNT